MPPINCRQLPPGPHRWTARLLPSGSNGSSRAHQSLVKLARNPKGAGHTALRRRLIRLFAEIRFHPYWARPRPGAGRVELLGQARALHREQEG
ncbi:hypothetical protein ABZ567_30235 [Streptomyces sp. NPDC016459]|uniref:hypothetical protein n=1 Tax=Streptomyces sp. NPDC016459 TaxID=3157190 RepID=UPI0034008549